MSWIWADDETIINWVFKISTVAESEITMGAETTCRLVRLFYSGNGRCRFDAFKQREA